MVSGFLLKEKCYNQQLIHEECVWYCASKTLQGNVIITGRKSPFSLYSESLVTFEEGTADYNHSDAEGFIKLNALRLRVRLRTLNKDYLTQTGPIEPSLETCFKKPYHFELIRNYLLICQKTVFGFTNYI